MGTPAVPHCFSVSFMSQMQNFGGEGIQITPPRATNAPDSDTSAALSAYKRKRMLLASAAAATEPRYDGARQNVRALSTAASPSRPLSRGRAVSRGAKRAPVSSRRRDVTVSTEREPTVAAQSHAKQGDRAWRQGRPGTRAQRARSSDHDVTMSGSRYSSSANRKQEPFVQVFVSPRRAIVSDPPTTRTSLDKPLSVPSAAPTRASAVSTSVASSIGSARALMDDIERLLGRPSNVNHAPSPISCSLETPPASDIVLPAAPFSLPSVTIEAVQRADRQSISSMVPTETTVISGPSVSAQSDASRVRLTIRLHQLTNTVRSST
jgi:hypothetical protein